MDHEKLEEMVKEIRETNDRLRDLNKRCVDITLTGDKGRQWWIPSGAMKQAILAMEKTRLETRYQELVEEARKLLNRDSSEDQK